MAQTYTTGLIITGDASGGIRAIKATEDELGKLNQRFDRGARQSKQFGSDASRAGQQLREIDTGANDASRGLEVLRSNVVGVAAAMATAFGANSIIQQSRIIADTDALAQSIGIATSELQAWDYAAQQAGFAGGQMGDILKDITEKIGEFTAEGTGEAAALFENLNLNIEEMKRLSPDQQLLRISEAISTLETRGEKISYLERLGNDATRLLPLLDNNAALLREYTNEAQALGVAMSQVDIENAVQANRAMAQLSGTIDGFKNQIAADLGPGLAEVVSGLTAFIQEAGGASSILNEVKDVAAITAAVMAGRYAAAMVTATQATLQKLAADRAAAAQSALSMEAEAGRAAMQARTTAAEMSTAAVRATIAAQEAAQERAAAAQDVQRLQRLQAQLAAEKTLAAQRLAEQSNAAGRMQVQARINQLHAAELTATNQLTAATTRLNQAEAAAVSTKRLATAASIEKTRADTAATAAVGRYTAATHAATSANTLLAASGRAASSALALVGGSLGLLVGAGALLYAFREEIGLVRQAVEPTTERIDNLTDAINRNSVAAVEAGIVNLSAEYFTLGQRAAATTAQIERLTAAQENDRQGAQARLQNNMRLRDLREELAQIVTEQEAAGEASTRLRETLEGLGETAVPTTSSLTDLGDATETAAAKAQAHADAADAQAAALEELRNRLIPGRRETVQLARDTNTLALAMAMGRGNTAQLIQMMGQLQKEYIEGQRETDNLAESTVQAAFTMEGAWDEVRLNGLRRLDDGIANMWQNAIDGSLDAGEAMKRILNQTLAEMAHMAITRPIMVQIAGSMGMGGGGIPGIGGGFGGINLNSLGSLGSLGNTVSGWFGGGAAAGAAPIGYASGFGAQAATGTYTGWAGSAAAGAAKAGGGILSSVGGLGGAASMAGMAYMGYQIGDAIGKKFAGDAKYGSNLGGLTGGIVPIISKGLFGGSWQTKDSGLQLGVSSGDFVGNRYERQRKSGGLFSGSSYRTQTSALDAELEASLSQTYEAQELALRASLETLGQQSDALNSFSAGLQKISTKGKSEAEIEQAVQEWLQGIVNRAAQSVVDPGDFALAGETTVDTLNRLATALTGVNPIMEQLHGNAFAASLAGGDAAASLVALSGGMDLFTQRADYYYQNFYSETERQQAAMDQAAQAMGEFTAQTGKIVTSADQLRELVDGIDRNTQSGRELYAAAMQLAPALVEVENGLERVRGRFADMLSDAENALSSAEQQARNAYAAFEKQSFDQQMQLLGLLGDEQTALALQRERELQGIDPLLQETQRRIWAMEDEAAAQQDATRAGQEYARSLAQVNDQLSSTFNGISQWVDQQSATAGTPGMNLTEAGDQFARQLVLAQSGDRNALQSITQYAEQYLAAGEAMYASGGAFQRIQGDVLDALKDLPDQITAEEYLAQEIRDALQDAVNNLPGGIADALHPMFDSIDLDTSGLIDWNEFYGAFQGLATDDELRRIFRQLDKDGSGTISRLEALNRSSEGTEGNTQNLEERARDQLSELGGLVSEMTRTTDQFVGLNSGISSLSDSINALGVAQAEVARIEKERAAAEKAERERIAKERDVAQRQAAYEANALRYDSAATAASQQASRLGSRLDARDVGNITSLIDRRMSDGVFTNSEWEQMLAHLDKTFGRDSLAYLFGREYAAAYRNETRADEERGKAARLDGSHATGLWSVPFDGYLAELHREEMVVPAKSANLLRELPSRELPMPALPNFPLLNRNDQQDLVRDLLNENKQLRKELNARLGKIEKHSAAAVAVQQAGFNGQINEQKKSNLALDDMSAAARLEASR